MHLSRGCKQHWGFEPGVEPFGKHIESPDGLYVWPAFDELVRRIVRAIEYRDFLVVVGEAASCKTTAWTEAKRRVREKPFAALSVCEPRGLEPRNYAEQTIYRAILRGIAGPDARQKCAKEDRAIQVRRLLEAENDAGRAVVFAVADAHVCRGRFLVACKRLWDDLYGFDRLCSVVLVAQPAILTTVGQSREISERTEVVQAPGLGKHVEDWLQHECGRGGLVESPFDDAAVRRLTDLAKVGGDHPLVVSNLASRALELGYRIKAKSIGADLVAKAIREERAFGLREEAQA